jgi:hypothetical protein
VFEKKVLRRMFGPKREEMVGGWRRVHNEELHDLYTSLNIGRVVKSRRMRWVWYIGHMGEMRSIKILVGKPEGKVWTGCIWHIMGTSGRLL